MEVKNNGLLYKSYDSRPKTFLVKWATPHTCRVSVGTINLPKKYAGRRFRLRVEWLDE